MWDTDTILVKTMLGDDYFIFRGLIINWDPYFDHLSCHLAFVHPLPWAPIMVFELFIDDKVALVVGAKRGHEKEL